jgi:protein ImuB
MLCWLALCLPPCPATPTEGTGSALSPQQALACWALQFTPRVALHEEAVLLEVHASERLFGGAQVLRERIDREARAMGCTAVACAPTSLAALALARASLLQAGQHEGVATGHVDGLAQPLPRLLNRLPLSVLSIVAANQGVLSRLGCRTLGDVRKLPRGGLNRRFVAELLTTLDQAYGERAESHEWQQLPEVFEARLELPGRVDTAPALMEGAQRLLMQMAGWLAARRAGVRRFTLRWHHDAMRSSQVSAQGALSIHTAEITRHVDHLARLLREHLARVTLAAPVGDLILCADEVEPLADVSGSLLLEEGQKREPLHELLERLAARLGPSRVRRPVLVSDHRLEWMQHWQAANEPLPRQGPQPAELGPQPSWVLPQPLKLGMRQHRPVYQGLLQLMAGPQRIESGWWHANPSGPPGGAHDVERDYYIALSPQAGLLWVYCERMPSDEGDGQWFLHGMFA